MKCRILQEKYRIVPISADTTDKAPDNVQEIYKYVLEKASLFITTDTAVEILGVKYRRARAVLLSMVEKRRCFTKYDLRKIRKRDKVAWP